ncbi:MAG: winged helix-turn-helix transcriptional regulator [Prevotella sp.]|nr:winged helix-turn-helix transcriptional regulator [Prevotella sp.]
MNSSRLYIMQDFTYACCHRAYNIKGTEIQIKMFDDRLVFESPGKLPGQVKPNNIRHTHFSRNPKIAAFLKAYHYVKEFGEGFDRICREQEANGASVPSFRTDEFILKISVSKVTEKRTETEQKRDVNEQNRIETEQKPNRNAVKLTEKREAILQLMSDNPYVSKAEISKLLGLHLSAVSRNIEAIRGKFLRRVGPDKGGFWVIIK